MSSKRGFQHQQRCSSKSILSGSSKPKLITEFFESDKTLKKETVKEPAAKRSKSVTQIKKKLQEDQPQDELEEDNEDMQILESLSDIDVESSSIQISHFAIANNVNKFLESEKVKRLQEKDELSIQFECPLNKNIGKLGKIFKLANLSQLKSATNANLDITELDLLFLTSPSSRLRIALLERLHFQYFNAGFAIPFDTFSDILCYVFQVLPNSLFNEQKTQNGRFEHKFNQWVKALDQFVVHDEQQQLELQQENAQLLLDTCWPYLRFDHWDQSQHLLLLRALSRLYLDERTYELHNQLKRAIQMIPSDRAILSKFITAHLMPSTDQSCHRVLNLLFQFFNHFTHYEPIHRLQTIHVLLASFFDSSQSTFSSNLGEALTLLPKVVALLISNGQYNDIYLIYTRYLNFLTNNARCHLLKQESESSLKQALCSFEEAKNLLNRKKLNNKMIWSWALFEHLVREELQNRRHSSHNTAARVASSIYRSLDDSSSDEESTR